MDDLMNKLQSVLNDEESMKQIKELADMLSGETTGASENPPAVQKNPPKNNSVDFSQFLKNLGGETSSQPQNQGQSIPDIDISKLMQLTSLISSANKQDKNVDLLLALKPLLKEENQVKIDRLVKIFKLFAIYPAIKESGLLGGDFFGLF